MNSTDTYGSALGSICERSIEQGWKTKCGVETGNGAARILRLTSDSLADLMVMGVRGVGAFAQTASRFGSTAHKLISEARCPVLTVTEANQATDH
jgi:nucleotide-binding universal stress UspA family protein